MLSIVIGLVLLMVLAYLGWSIIWVAPIVAGVVALLSGLDLTEAYTQTYMQGFVDFTKKWFPIFLLGAVFGKLMEDTGAAKAVAFQITKFIGKKRAILGVLVASAILTYGGVSLFVVVFAIYPIALALFKEANISRKLIAPTIVLGAFTFTMTSVPGTPQIQNLIPMDSFKTTPMAGSLMGIVATIIMAAGGYFWLAFREKKMTAAGDTFKDIEKEEEQEESEQTDLPNWILSLVPLLIVVILLDFVKLEPIPSLLAGILAILVINIKQYKKFIGSINEGAKGSGMAILNTSAAVGFGAVVTAVPEFKDITEMLLGISNNPLVSESIIVQILAMITGSASGGMGIALQALGNTYFDLAQTTGMSPEAFHRMASIASGASILPHNGALLTLLAVTRLTHKDCYKDVFMVGLVIPTIAMIVGIIMASIGII
ncbi:MULTISPECIES: GntP family permease [unclassified Bacillus (in: firmicutes)]|uniref:GntP family permease n=1 Tax=unclassified Bacillus (in: firmicutes) TaxID=185979 RepID=UPI0008EB9A29|nr:MULTISPECIES: GntP family permease [unclassified Bacillus (in: firmicutes)]SFB02619.1 H+/gluconate symporter [Bacillus sp. UNCCL13]SFQ89038.1 H+/gluconate symporter [Bacillus sp. cl95]